MSVEWQLIDATVAGSTPTAFAGLCGGVCTYGAALCVMLNFLRPDCKRRFALPLRGGLGDRPPVGASFPQNDSLTRLAGSTNGCPGLSESRGLSASHLGVYRGWPRAAAVAYEQAFDMSAEQPHGTRISVVLGESAYQRAEPYLGQASSGQRAEFENVMHRS